MKHTVVLLVACLALVACGRSRPEEMKVDAARAKVATIHEIVAADNWADFLDLALSGQERAALLKEKTAEQFSAEMVAKDMTAFLGILEQMEGADAYYYHAEGDEQVAFPLAEPVGDTEVVTMKLDDSINEWVLHQSRKAQ